MKINAVEKIIIKFTPKEEKEYKETIDIYANDIKFCEINLTGIGDYVKLDYPKSIYIHYLNRY